jgi:selenide,water dikinase
MAQTIRMTQLSSGGGCASKLPAAALAEVLQGVPHRDDPNVLVSGATFDDAAVIRLDDGSTLIQTIDAFGPVVDDPYDYGRIAAANAISDVYAMGGIPRFALAILAIPAGLGSAVTTEILRGGAATAHAAGVSIVGGHTVTAPEPLYGLAVTGLAPDGSYWVNSGGRPGDLLCLSKPLGSGIIANAMRNDAAPPAVLAAGVEVMAATNAAAAEALRAIGPTAVVDVTGFGLVGHLHNLLRESGCAAEVDLAALPLIPGVRELVEADIIPGGSRRNRAAAAAYMTAGTDAVDALITLACDAQTSGGLLAAVPADTAAALLPGPVIGRLVEGTAGTVALI